jgi:hypothetical protein
MMGLTDRKGIGMNIDKERNRNSLDRITFHLDQAMRFCDQMDLSGLGPLEQKKWNDKMKICKDAIKFTKEAIEQLSKILE